MNFSGLRSQRSDSAGRQHLIAASRYLPGPLVVVQVMVREAKAGELWGNIAATLARHTNAPVMLEYSRRDDWLGMHGRWPTVQQYKVGVTNDGTVTAIQLIGYSGMGPYRKNAGGISGLELYACPHRYRSLSPVYTNRTTSGNFRAPSEPHGVYGLESIMDNIAYTLGMDPVEFTLKNMLRPTAEQPFTN